MATFNKLEDIIAWQKAQDYAVVQSIDFSLLPFVLFVVPETVRKRNEKRHDHANLHPTSYFVIILA